MKGFFNILILTVLAIAASVSGEIASSVIPRFVAAAPASATTQSAPIPISLPDLAVITLNGGGERSGKVVGFDLQKQILLLQRGSDSTSVPLSQIAKVVYDHHAPFYREQGEPVIRGENASPTGSPVTWNNVPLSSFRLSSTSRGQADMMLDSVLSSSQLRGVRAVASSSTYVLDAMQFNLQQKTMTVSVTPY